MSKYKNINQNKQKVVYRGSEDLIDIFTDVSTTNVIPGPVCYGFITMYKGYEINSGICVNSNSNSAIGEIRAIKLAVFEAIRLRQIGFDGLIRVFSDSQATVYTLIDWLFNWNLDSNLNIITGSNRTSSTSNEFIEIINLIANYDLDINFYDQKSHCVVSKSSYGNYNANKRTVLRGAANYFINANEITAPYTENIDTSFIKYICDCNNEIDNRTRWHLTRQIELDEKKFTCPISFVPISRESFYNNRNKMQQHINSKGDPFYV